MESFDASPQPDDPGAGQAPEQEAGGEEQTTQAGGAVANLYDELAQAYEEADEGEYEPPTIGELTTEARQDSALWQQLGQEHPGIWTNAAISAMKPVADKVAAEYGQAAVNNPEVVREIYRSVGGDAAFAGALEREVLESEYAGAFAAELGGIPRTREEAENAQRDPLTGNLILDG